MSACDLAGSAKICLCSNLSHYENVGKFDFLAQNDSQPIFTFITKIGATLMFNI